MYPIFFSDVIKHVFLSIEVSRAWIILNIIIIDLMNTNLDMLTHVLIAIIDLSLIVVFTILLNRRVSALIVKGIRGVKNENDFHINLYYLGETSMKSFFYHYHFLFL